MEADENKADYPITERGLKTNHKLPATRFTLSIGDNQKKGVPILDEVLLICDS